MSMKKLLTSTALSLLLVSLASGVYGQNVETINYPNGSVFKLNDMPRKIFSFEV
jgi:hypothetical protein